MFFRQFEDSCSLASAKDWRFNRLKICSSRHFSAIRFGVCSGVTGSRWSGLARTPYPSESLLFLSFFNFGCNVYLLWLYTLVRMYIYTQKQTRDCPRPPFAVCFCSPRYCVIQEPRRGFPSSGAIYQRTSPLAIYSLFTLLCVSLNEIFSLACGFIRLLKKKSLLDIIYGYDIFKFFFFWWN